MRTFVLDGMENAADIEKGDLHPPQHDTRGLSGGQFVHTKGFHLGILGGLGWFAGKHGRRVLVTVTVTGRSD